MRIYKKLCKHELALFLEVLYVYALEHPEKLKDAKDVWGKRADKLLNGVVPVISIKSRSPRWRCRRP